MAKKPPDTEGSFHFQAISFNKFQNLFSNNFTNTFLPMNSLNTVKTLSQIASEYTTTPKTLSSHIKKHEVLRAEIQSGLQLPKQQKLIYDTFGYPPGVNKKDYEQV
jgi:hypothetical protein